MKRLKITLGFLATLIMLTVLFPAAARADAVYDGDDVGELRAFLNQRSTNPAKSNGQIINPAYNENDPSTWTGVEWSDTSSRHITKIGTSVEWNSSSRTDKLAGNMVIRDLPMLTDVYVQENALASLDVSGDSVLNYLRCDNNNLTSMDLNGDTALDVLLCDHNLLGSLNVSGLTGLYRLYCSYNKLQTLDVSSNVTMEELQCKNNNLTSLNLIGAKKLGTVFCENNNLTSFAHNSDYMFGIYCGGNKITSIDLSNSSELYYLSCENNLLTSLDVSGAPGLQDIDCSGNQLESLDLRSLRYLFRLNCANNHLHEIYASIENKGSIHLSTDGSGKGYVELNAGASYHPTITLFSYEGGEILANAEPIPGAHFDNWTEGNDIYSDDNEIELEEYMDYNLVAHFGGEGNLPVTHRVKFNPYYGIRTGGGLLEQTVEDGTNAVEPVLSREGFIFQGWDRAFTNVKEDITVTAKWTAIPSNQETIPNYLVIFNLNGGVNIGHVGEIQIVNHGERAYEPVVKRDGYRLAGWDKAFDHVVDNLTVTALWEEITHTVTFDLNGGTRTGDGELVQKVKDGGAATAPAVVREGYTFKGWDKAYDHVTEDLTVTAQWEEIVPVKYSVLYDANGGDGEVPIDSALYLSGDTVVLADGSGLSKENYEFTGWALTSDGAALEDSEYEITADTTFYAVWTLAEMSDAEDSTDQEGEEVISLPDTGDSLDIIWFLLLISAGVALTAEALRLRRKLIKK